MKKELLIYLTIIILSALFMHFDLLTDPLHRIEMMSEQANYYHPFLFGFGLYLIIGLFRLIILGIKKILALNAKE